MWKAALDNYGQSGDGGVAQNKQNQPEASTSITSQPGQLLPLDNDINTENDKNEPQQKEKSADSIASKQQEMASTTPTPTTSFKIQNVSTSATVEKDESNSCIPKQGGILPVNIKPKCPTDSMYNNTIFKNDAQQLPATEEMMQTDDDPSSAASPPAGHRHRVHRVGTARGGNSSIESVSSDDADDEMDRDGRRGAHPSDYEWTEDEHVEFTPGASAATMSSDSGMSSASNHTDSEESANNINNKSNRLGASAETATAAEASAESNKKDSDSSSSSSDHDDNDFKVVATRVGRNRLPLSSSSSSSSSSKDNGEKNRKKQEPIRPPTDKENPKMFEKQAERVATVPDSPSSNDAYFPSNDETIGSSTPVVNYIGDVQTPESLDTWSKDNEHGREKDDLEDELNDWVDVGEEEITELVEKEPDIAMKQREEQVVRKKSDPTDYFSENETPSPEHRRADETGTETPRQLEHLSNKMEGYPASDSQQTPLISTTSLIETTKKILQENNTKQQTKPITEIYDVSTIDRSSHAQHSSTSTDIIVAENSAFPTDHLSSSSRGTLTLFNSNKKFVFLSDEKAVPQQLGKLQEQSIRQRHQFQSTIHNLECRVAELTARLANESMDTDIELKAVQEEAIYKPLEQSYQRMSLDRARSCIGSTRWIDIEKRMSSLDSQMTHSVFVAFHETKRQTIDSLRDEIENDIKIDFKVDAVQADKKEGALVRKFEETVGSMSRRYQEERATRMAAIQLLDDEQVHLANKNSMSTDASVKVYEKLLNDIQTIRELLATECAARQSQDMNIREQVHDRHQHLQSSILEAFGDS